jgi:pyrroloquinoline quinone biosynthesis protein E
MNAPPRPLGLLAELTHRCPLHCPYCSNPLELARREEELAPELWESVLTQAAALGVLHAGFSGGEPLLFPALARLVAEANKAGLYTNLITSGVGLGLPKAQELKVAGLDTVQISFQADDAELGDAIAGAQVHRRKLQAVAAVRSAGLPWSANVVLHQQNIGRLGQIIRFVETLGASRVELANTQYYGWAFANRQYLLPSRSQIEEAAEIVERESTRLRGKLQIVYVLPDYYGSRPKPCLHGWGNRSLTVNPRGDVLPCQTASCITGLVFDNVREKSLAAIWESGAAFQRFRGTEWMIEPCRSCALREIDFGGCRCQAALFAGDAAQADPVCQLSPHRPMLDLFLEQAQAQVGEASMVTGGGSFTAASRSH